VSVMTILVTGGAGFVGSHVTEELAKTGHQVIVLDDLSGGVAGNVVEDATLIQGSITDVELVNTLFGQYNFTYVFHFAAYAAEGLSHFIRRFNYENNLIGSINLINASVNYGVKCFVFASSIAVYGKNQLPMHEALVPEPEDPYGVAKLAVEQDLKIAHKMFGLPYIVFRPHNIYGERQNITDKYRNVVGIFMNQIMNNQSMTIFGDGTQTRAFSYIRDVAPIMAHSIFCQAAYNQIFNIGADKESSIRELAHCVAAAMGVEPQIVYLERREEVHHAYASHDKAERVFGKRQTVDLLLGLRNMAEWVKQIGPRDQAKSSRIEITKNLPKAWL
jgi:UDP-glucose 4-epimerase